MTDNLETIAAEIELGQSSEDENLAMGAEGNEEAETKQEPKEEPKPDPKDEEIARLSAQLKQKDDRLAAYKGDKKLIANMVKGIMDDFGLNYEEAVKYAGNIQPNDLKARLESADVADNPFEVQAQAFNNLYVNAGVKATLDEVYGEDTQAFVSAFEKAMKVDDNLAQEFSSMEPTRLPAFVVKKGKEVLEKSKAAETLADENARLKAEIAALRSGKEPTEEVAQRKTLPLSGMAPSGGIGRQSASYAERLFT